MGDFSKETASEERWYPVESTTVKGEFFGIAQAVDKSWEAQKALETVGYGK